MRPIELTCDARRNPLAVDLLRPRLAFLVAATHPGVGLGASARVSAWQVQVASDPGFDAVDLWDSGRVEGDRTFEIAYGGLPLALGAGAHWRARVWDLDRRLGPWSEVARWEAAPGPASAWGAQWIAAGPEKRRPDRERYGDDPAPHLRLEFELADAPVRARLHWVGLGWSEVRINGEPVTDAHLEPAWTPYRKRVLYSSADVTALLSSGPNAIGALLGKGWYDPLPMRMWGYLNLREHLECGRPKLLLRLEWEDAQGRRGELCSDERWRVGDGALRRDNVYLGEVWDARRTLHGWSEAGFDDSSWPAACEVAGPPGELEPQSQPPVRVLRRLKPVALLFGPEGEPIVDFGENVSGLLAARASGPEGTRIRFRYGEVLEPDGRLNLTTSLCGKIKPGGDSGGPGAPELACQEDAWILAGADGEERFESRFTFHAFRYMEVTGWPGGLREEDLEGGALELLRLSADLPRAGEWRSSSPRLEAIERAARRTFRNNLIGVQSDCPHRERFGYGGDLVACAEAVAFCFDVSRFYRKTVRDFADEARRGGGLPETAPDVGIDYGGIEPRVGPVEWGTALPHLLDLLHRFYGETDEVRRRLDVLRRWVRYLERQAPEGLMESGLSDWEALEERPKRVTGSAFLHENARLLARLERALGAADDDPSVVRTRDFAGRVAQAFRSAFVEDGWVRPGNQVSQAHAVGLGLLEAGELERAFEILLATVAHRDGRFATGFFGTRLLFESLTARDRSDVALGAVDRDDFPSYGYMLSRGASTLWEQWPWDTIESSHDHPALGSVVAWFYRGLAGIHPEGAVGGELRLRPQVDCGLESVSARYRTVRGWVSVSWQRTGAEMRFLVGLPANLRARLSAPGIEGERLLEPGRSEWCARLHPTR